MDYFSNNCPGLFSVTVINTIDNSNLRKGFLSPYSLQFIIEGSQSRNSRQELHAETIEKGTFYWVASSALLSLLYHVAETHLPRADTTHSGLGPPTSVSNVTVSYRHACQPV